MKFFLLLSTFIAIILSQETDLQKLQSQLEGSHIEFISMNPYTAIILHTKKKIEYSANIKGLLSCRAAKPETATFDPLQTHQNLKEPMFQDYELRESLIKNALNNSINSITWERLDPLPHTYIIDILRGDSMYFICLDLYDIWFKSKLIFHKEEKFNGVLIRFAGNITQFQTKIDNISYQVAIILIDPEKSPQLEFVTHFLAPSHDIYQSIQSLATSHNWYINYTRRNSYCPTTNQTYSQWPETKSGRVAIPLYYCGADTCPRRSCLGSVQEGAYWETVKEPTHCLTSNLSFPFLKLLERNSLEGIRDFLLENSAELNINDVNIISMALKAQVGKPVNISVLAEVLERIIEKYDYDSQMYDNAISSLMAAILDTVDMFIPYIQYLGERNILNKYVAAVSISTTPGFALYDAYSLILLEEGEPAHLILELNPELGVYFLNEWNEIHSTFNQNMHINFIIMKEDFFFPSTVRKYGSNGYIVGVGMVSPGYRFGGATLMFAFKKDERVQKDFSCAMWDPKIDEQWVISPPSCSKGVTKESLMDICLCNVFHSGIVFFTRVYEEQNTVDVEKKKQSLELLYKKSTREITLYLNVNLTRYGRPEDLLECSVKNYGINYPIYFHSGMPVLHKYKDNKSEYLNKQQLFKVIYKGEGSMICTDKLGFGLVSNEIPIREDNVAVILFSSENYVIHEIDKFVNDYPTKYLLPHRLKVVVQWYSIIDGQIKLRFWQSLNKNHTNFMESVKILSQRLSQDYQWSILYLRSVLYCPSVEEEGFLWPMTPCGFPAIPINPCLDSKGVASPTRLCIGDYIEGSYWKPPPKTPEECNRHEQSHTFLLNAAEKKDKIAAIKEASKILEYSQTLNPYEISVLAKVLREAADEVCFSRSSPPNITSLAIIMDSILAGGREALRIANDSTGSSQFLRESVEVLLAAAAVSTPTIVSKQHFSALTVTLSSGIQGFAYDSSRNKIIPLFGNETTSDLHMRTSAVVRDSDLTDGIVTSVVFHDDSLFESSNKDLQIHGNVIGISLFLEDESRFWEYGLPLELFLLFPRGDANDPNFICQFWDPIEGDWSSIGCRAVEDSSFPEEMVACICTHITYFTLLISPKSIREVFNDNVSGYPNSTHENFRNTTKTEVRERYSNSDIEKHEVYLYILSIVGCSISLVSLILVLILASVFQRFRKGGRKKIHANISLSNALFMSSYLVIASYGRPPTTEEIKFCTLFGVLLHYSLLTTFCWSFMSALLLISKFRSKLRGASLAIFRRVGTHYVLRAAIFSWVFPAVIVVLSLFTGIHQYKRREYSALCFPEGTAFIVFVLVPISLIYLLNICVFFHVVHFIWCARKETNAEEYGETHLKQFYYTLLYFSFLGISWIFGIVLNFIPSMTVHMMVIFSYCFCALATLQGVSMFFLFVVCEHFIKDAVYYPQTIHYNVQREEIRYLSVRTKEIRFNGQRK